MVRGLATSPTDSKKRAVYIFFTSFSEPNSKLSIIWACKTKKQKFRPQIASAGMCKWIISDWKNVECSCLSPNKESKDFVQVSWSTALRNCRKLSPTLNTSKLELCARHQGKYGAVSPQCEFWLARRKTTKNFLAQFIPKRAIRSHQSIIRVY